MTWQQFLDLLHDELGLDVDGLDPSDELRDVGIDSLATLELVLALEERGGFRFPDELIDALRTLGDAWSWADARLPRAVGA